MHHIPFPPSFPAYHAIFAAMARFPMVIIAPWEQFASEFYESSPVAKQDRSGRDDEAHFKSRASRCSVNDSSRRLLCWKTAAEERKKIKGDVDINTVTRDVMKR
jgi:hypothetical protein